MAGADGALPQLEAALLCRRILCDVATSEHTLVDIVLAVTAPALPVSETLQVYVCLTGVAEPLRLRVELAAAGGELVFRGELGVDSPDGSFPFQRVLAVASPPFAARFTAAGPHELRVYQAGRLLGSTPVMVVIAA